MGNVICRYIQRRRHSSSLVIAQPKLHSRRRQSHRRRRVWAISSSSSSSSSCTNNKDINNTCVTDDDDEKEREEDLITISNVQNDACFSFHWKHLSSSSSKKNIFYLLNRERYGEVGNKIMYRDCCSHLSTGLPPDQSDLSYTYETFNDLPDYLRVSSSSSSLSSLETSVQLYKVSIQFLNTEIIGLQSFYKIVHGDDQIFETPGTNHLSFFYTKRYGTNDIVHAQNMVDPNLLHWNQLSLQSFEVEEQGGEFISSIVTNRDESGGGELTGMTFVTNRRVVHIGSCRRRRRPTTFENEEEDDDDDGRIQQIPLKKASNNAPRIVALTGVTMIGNSSTRGRNVHCIQKIGYYTEHTAWMVLGPLVMMRWLYEEERAVKKKDEEGGVVIMHDLVELPDEMWRHVLSFLVA